MKGELKLSKVPAVIMPDEILLCEKLLRKLSFFKRSSIEDLVSAAYSVLFIVSTARSSFYITGFAFAKTIGEPEGYHS